MEESHEADEQLKDDRKLKNVTIRGIDSGIYDEFSHSMKILNMNIGDAVTKMMRDVMEDLDETFTNLDIRSNLSSKRLFKKLKRGSISHHRKLIISADDLIEANARFTLSHIEELIFLPDVTQELFSKHIRSVSHCKEVKVPDSLPKLYILSKIQFCKKIVMYSAKDEIIDKSFGLSTVANKDSDFDEYSDTQEKNEE